MLNDDEKKIVSSSEMGNEPDGAANNTSQAEVALCNPMETGVEVTGDASQSKDEVVYAMPVTEKVVLRSEEEMCKESGKLNNVKEDKYKGAKASKSSWRLMFHEKENVNISSQQIISGHYDVANYSKSENVNPFEYASQSKDDEENAMPGVENVTFGSEELKIQESEIEDEKKFEQNDLDGDRNSEANAVGKTYEMDDNDQQKEDSEMQGEKKLQQSNVDEVKSSEATAGEKDDDQLNKEGEKEKEKNGNDANELGWVSDQTGDNSKKEATTVEKPKRKKVEQRSSLSVAPTFEVKAGSSSENKKVLKKAERTGMIFMCSKRTKQDCFYYKVFGLPANKRDVVRNISKGMRLFLFDIDLRVMYGIYKAAAPGGYNIEPNAFQSAFPSQVRFTVVKDCTPLAEEKFKVAIRDNYYRKNMFNCQLTSEQVKKLSELFVAASRGPNLSLGNDDVAIKSRGNELPFSPSDMDVEENGCKVKQATSIDEEMDQENGAVSDKGKTATEENEETATEEEKKNEEDLIVEQKTNKVMRLGVDVDGEENPIEEGEEEESASGGVTGMIFVCNSKTKQDCLHYKVLGLPANKIEIVQKVYKGMRLFMFDVDLRVMYGIYKAAEPGGFNIEPMAFNSGFPSQVRFAVVKDCAPLTEEKFRVAIKDNYYRKNKFNFQLTSEQVNKLSKLFVAATRSPDLSIKDDDVANASQSKAILLNPVDLNAEGNCVKAANPIEEAINEENHGKTGIEEKNIEVEKKDEGDFMLECETNEPMSLQQDCKDGESSGEEEEEEEVVGANSEEKVGKKRKRWRKGKLLERAGSTGMIFMCNSKTKQDCLHYKVLGLPANKREIVQKIPKGMRLFMFDVDLRVMYGIYEAAGQGGYNIEPRAFNSCFPSQVQFTVLKDCLPLGEEFFKVAIKDNYYTNWKFNCELTSEQVKNLCKLFSSASKGRDRITQQNLDTRYPHPHRRGGGSYVERVVVPMAQLPPLAQTSMHVSYRNANAYRGGPRFRAHGKRQGSSRYRPSRRY